MTRSLTQLAAAWAALSFLAMPAAAEVPASTRVQPKGPVGQVQPIPGAIKRQPLKIQPFTYVINFPLLPADMTGWSTRTAGPTKGGGVFVKSTNRILLFARGADDYLYAAPIDPVGQGPVASSAWVSTGDKSTSEPACIGYPYQWQNETHTGIVCAFLGSDGNALWRYLGDQGDQLFASWQLDMKGKNAGAAPTILDAPEVVSGLGGSSHYYGFGVWDGKSALFTRSAGWLVALSSGGANAKTKWTKLSTPFTAPPGCALDLCVMHDGQKASIIVLKGDGSEPVLKGASPALEGGITGKPAIVALPNSKYSVVVRGPKGVVHQIVYDAKAGTFTDAWKNEGGYITAGSSPNCIAVNVQPVCVVQGGDGKLYSKGLASSAGF